MMPKLLTRQAIFDLAINGIIAQGAFSVADRDMGILAGQCRYRGPNNTRCAIGMLIPDAEYVPEMEGKSSSQALSGSNLFEGFAPDVDHNFLSALQNTHDAASNEADPWPFFQLLAAETATEFHLSLANITFKETLNAT
jgi:hypothetical protein